MADTIITIIRPMSIDTADRQPRTITKPWAVILTLALFAAALFAAMPAQAADPCGACLAFDRLDKQIRDGRLSKDAARQQFAAAIDALDAYLAGGDPAAAARGRWVFPLRGYTLPASAGDAAKGYVTAGYDYFDGNRHGGHPSFDLFIHDRDQDSRDDRSGAPVTVLAITGGLVIAAETAWESPSALRGGKYLWIYDAGGKRLFYYAHNRDLLVGVGDRVEPGTPIATVGRSGLNAAKRRSPTHLHLTVLRIIDRRPQPENILPALAGAAVLPAQ